MPTSVDRIVAQDVEATWDALIGGLRGRDFEINSAAKEGRVLEILVRSEIPSQYVDCGDISVRSRHRELGNRDYDFAAANSARYLVADARSDTLVDVERRTSLNALARVRLTPNGHGTQVSVTALYAMRFNIREFGEQANPNPVEQRANFASLGHAQVEEKVRESNGSRTITMDCRPTGELERRILSIVG